MTGAGRSGSVILPAKGAPVRSAFAPLSEKELIGRVLRGDPRAEELFYGTFRPRLLRAATYFLGGQDPEVEDLVQETFLIALPRLRHYVFKAPVYAWLRQICLRLCYVRLRSRGRMLVAQEADLELALRGAASERVQSGEREVQRMADLRLLHRLIRGLGPDSRQIIELRSLQGMRYDVISRTLGIPMGTVMSRLARARTQMKRLLEEGPGTEGGAGGRVPAGPPDPPGRGGRGIILGPGE